MSSNLDRGSEKEGVEKVDAGAPKESSRFTMFSDKGDTRELEDAVRSTLRETDSDAGQLRRVNRRLGLLGEQMENIELLQRTILESTDKMILAQTMMMRHMDAHGLAKSAFGAAAGEDEDEKEGGDSWLKTAGIVGGTLLARSIFTGKGLQQAKRLYGFAKKAIPYVTKALPYLARGLGPAGAVITGVQVLNAWAPKGAGAKPSDATQSAEDGAMGGGVPVAPQLDGAPAQLQNRAEKTSLDPKSIKSDKPIRFETTDTIKFKANRIRFESTSITGIGTQSGGGRSPSPATTPNSGSSAVDVYRPGENRDSMIQEGLGGRAPSAPSRGGSYGGSAPDFVPSQSIAPPSGPQFTPIPDQSRQYTPIPTDRGYHSPIPREADKGKGGQAYLANARSGFKAELDANPALKDYVSRLMKAEHNHPAFAESLMNRVELFRKETGRPKYSIADYIREQGKFYGPIREGKVPQSLSDADRKKMDANWAEALGGSDHIKGATDQGSGNDPNVTHQGGRTEIGQGRFKEVYNDFGGLKRGHRAAQEWRQERQRAVAQAENERTDSGVQRVTPPPADGPVTSDPTADKFGSMRNQSRRTAMRRPESGEFNYALSERGQQEIGVTGRSPLVTIGTQGKKIKVNAVTAPRMQAFLDQLTARGYKIGELGGYSYRNKIGGGSGLSTHASGATMDINPSRNPYTRDGKTDMPENIEKLGWLYGMSWGARFGDAMHWELMSPELRQKKLDQLVSEGFVTQAQAEQVARGDFSGVASLAAAIPQKGGPQTTKESPLKFDELRTRAAALGMIGEDGKMAGKKPDAQGVPMNQRGITFGMSKVEQSAQASMATSLQNEADWRPPSDAGRMGIETMRHSTDKMNLVGRFSKETVAHSADKMVPGRFAEYAGGEKLRLASHTMPSPDNQWVSKQPQFDPLDPAITKSDFNSDRSQKFTEAASPQAKKTTSDYDDFIGDMHPEECFNAPDKCPPIVPKKRKEPGYQDNHNRSDD